MRIAIVSHTAGKRIALQAVHADLAERRPAWSSKTKEPDLAFDAPRPAERVDRACGLRTAQPPDLAQSEREDRRR